ncbi:MAG: division/cell wall cluster transcriptional repressor MraZ [Acidimicrobiia bacterium]
MFVGKYRHSLDDKGRLILPVKFRGQLAEGAFMARGPDQCICVYPAGEWERVANNMRTLATRGQGQRQAARTFFAGAAELNPDRQGRVLVPADLRDFAGVSAEGELVVAGVMSRVEIWDAGRWEEHERQGDQLISTAEDMPDFGI